MTTLAGLLMLAGIITLVVSFAVGATDRPRVRRLGAGLLVGGIVLSFAAA